MESNTEQCDVLASEASYFGYGPSQKSKTTENIAKNVQDVKRDVDVIRFHDMQEIKAKMAELEEMQKSIIENQRQMIFCLYNMNQWEHMAITYMQATYNLNQSIFESLNPGQSSSNAMVFSTPPVPVQYSGQTATPQQSGAI
jgi:hypothetical protein